LLHRVAITASEDGGFIARGGCAVLLLAIFTVAYLADLLSGDVPTRTHAAYWSMIVVSGILTAFSLARTRASSWTCADETCRHVNPGNHLNCSSCGLARATNQVASLRNDQGPSGSGGPNHVRSQAPALTTSLDLDALDVDEAVLQRISPSLARRYLILPISKVGAVLTVAAVDPMDVVMHDEVRFETGYRVEAVPASESSLRRAIEKHYGPHASQQESTGTRWHES